MAMVFFRFSYLDFAILTLINQSINLFNSGNEKNHKHTENRHYMNGESKKIA